MQVAREPSPVDADVGQHPGVARGGMPDSSTAGRTLATLSHSGGHIDYDIVSLAGWQENFTLDTWNAGSGFRLQQLARIRPNLPRPFAIPRSEGTCMRRLAFTKRTKTVPAPAVRPVAGEGRNNEGLVAAAAVLLNATPLNR